jgi:hypothetical protein
MYNNKNTFSENLDLLMQLFVKLRHKIVENKIPGIDKSMMENFEMILDNYNSIKEKVPGALLDTFGSQIEDMIEDMVRKLEAEVEAEEYDQDENLEPVMIINNTTNIKLLDIDLRLQNPNNTPEEINRLLDERVLVMRNS